MTGTWRRLRRAAGYLRDEFTYHQRLGRETLRDWACLVAARRGLLRQAIGTGLRGGIGAALAVLEGDGNAAWLAFLAGMYRRIGRRDDAIRLYGRVLVLDRERVSALIGLAACGGQDPPAGLFPATFLYHHLGLGDHILCNALVRHFAARHATLGLFVKRRYLESVRFMYRDNPGIRFFAVRDDREVATFLRRWPQAPCIRIGFENLDITRLSFAESFYQQVGLDYARRWDGIVPRDRAREEALYHRLVGQPGPYIFMHDDPGRGYVIDRDRLPAGVPVVRPLPGLTDIIFDYALVMERAAEIHCMDSSFRHVVDTLELSGPRLFLHLYAKGVDVRSRLPWTVLT